MSQNGTTKSTNNHWTKRDPTIKDMYKVIKVITIGDCGVGKTSLVERFSSDTFAASYIPTIGIDFVVQELVVDGSQYVKLHVWDTAGSEKFDAITRNYYHVANGAVVVYDITCKSSFIQAKTWIKKLEENCQPGIPKILIGNKSDLEAKRQITMAEGEEFAKKEDMTAFFETSAKTNQNVYRSFFKLAKVILQSTAADEKSKNEDLEKNGKSKLCQCLI